MDEKLIPSNLRKLNNDYAERIQRQRREADGLEGEGANISTRSASSTRGKPKPGYRYVRRKFGFQTLTLCFRCQAAFASWTCWHRHACQVACVPREHREKDV